MPTVSHRHFILRLLLPICGWLLVCLQTYAVEIEKPDSTKTHTIQEITVTEKYLNSEVRSSSPLQILSSKAIEGLNVLQVSDAVKYLSGVTVKDYGGIGGLKTVSVRSLGGNHTAVSYDGITLTDCQTGQIDLGRFSLDNVDMISLSSGQSDNIFQPASLFASASVLNIKTLTPVFYKDKNVNGKISMKAGSFGLLNPSVLLEDKINNKLSATFSGEWLSANGKYPYTLQYGPNASNITTQEIRQNTDVQNLRLEAALYTDFSENENGYVKCYYYQSQRGLPGPTILYNDESSSKQRMWDNTFFTQAHYEKMFSKFWVFQTNAKFNSGYLRYLDPTYQNSDGKLENTYLQKEYYGSASVLFRAFENLSFSASTDAAVNTLDADLTDFAYPTRFSWLTTVAAKYVTNQLLATASLLSTDVNEQVRTGAAATNYQQLSPYISLSIKPFINQDFRLRAFYKNIFRMPTFNDLYYSQVGNRDLKPEKANQFNLGLTYSTSVTSWFPSLSFTADAYHNDVIDKIVAYPNKDTFFWTIINYGKVAINGIDLTAETTFQPWKKIGVVLGTNYTYQRALNVTDPTDRDYNNQIPYTPRVSGSANAGIETPWVNISYSLLWSGHRYAVNQNYAENRLPAYADHSISANRSFKVKDKLIHINLEVLNLLNSNYEIVRWFPMPGRSFRATVSVKF
ncbi:MAG: TonB-dependent receptor [Paludibacter sp.]|nr:TonB-dependent receptor [Paludibacter sp.]